MRGHFHSCLERLWARLGDSELAEPHKQGAIRLGVSRKTLAAWRGTTQSRVDLNAMQKGEAAAILHVWYWRGVDGDELPEGLDQAVFELAVAEGPKVAITELQFALGVHPTGDLSARDLRKLESMPAESVLLKLSRVNAHAA